MEEYIKKFGGVHVIDEVETLLSDEKSAVDVLIEQFVDSELAKKVEMVAHWVADAYETMSYGKQNRIKRGLVPKAKYMYRLWKVTRGWNDGF